MDASTPRLFLLSNSTCHGQGYLDHAETELRTLFEGVTNLVFVPYALHDLDGYTQKARERFARLDIEVTGAHEGHHPADRIESAQAVFIGGGNTFRLLNHMYDHRLLDPIRERVRSGMPFAGASAGTNVAAASLKTTNDMPIVQPPNFDALGLVPFNINAHFIDSDANSTHMGETRELRISEFHEENPQPVLAMREGAGVRVEGIRAWLWGTTGAVLFRRGEDPVELQPETQLDDLLRG